MFFFRTSPKNDIVKNWETSHRQKHRIVKKNEHRPPLACHLHSAYVLQHRGMHFLRPCARHATNIFTNRLSVAFLKFCHGATDNGG